MRNSTFVHQTDVNWDLWVREGLRNVIAAVTIYEDTSLSWGHELFICKVVVIYLLLKVMLSHLKVASIKTKRESENMS